jgi:dolichyl-phosphate beta-glucosyltransferase
MPGRNPEGAASLPLVSLVLPGYNPGKEIEATWREVRRFLGEQPGTWEIIFVLDGCTDGTPDRLRALASGHAGQVRVLSYEPNRGKGYAVRLGLAAARAPWRIFTDIDLAYGWEDIRAVARTMQDGAEMVIASRQHPQSRITLPASLQGYIYRRHLQSRLFVRLAHWLLPLRQMDPQAGLKGMSAAVAERVLQHLRCDGFCFDCEILTACARFGITVTEVPVNVRYHDRASTTGLGSVGRMVKELWAIRKSWRYVPKLSEPVVAGQNREAA